MSEKAARWIFYAGTGVSLVLFLLLTLDTHSRFTALTHADRIDEHVISGKRAFERHNCNDCHTILGFGAYYAPDLTRAFDRLGENGLRRRLEHPEVAFAGSWRRMPQQRLTAQEVSDTIAFLRWVCRIENNDWPPQHSESRWKASTERLLAGAALSEGAALVMQEGCLTCHALGSRGEKVGPRLEWIGASRDAAWIARYLEDPQALAPGAEMEARQDLSSAQRASIGEFIVSLAEAGRREP